MQRREDGAAQDELVPDIHLGTAVFASKVVLVRRRPAGPVGIAERAAVSVVAERGEPPFEPAVDVQMDLILVQYSVRLVLKDIIRP